MAGAFGNPKLTSTPSRRGSRGDGSLRQHDGFFVDPVDLLDDLAPEPVSANFVPGGDAELPPKRGVNKEPTKSLGESIDVPRRKQNPGPLGLEDLGRPSDGGGGDRQPIEHAL